MAITLNGTTGITTPALDNQGNLTVDGGTIKLDGNYPVGTNNVALGDVALSSLTTGIRNTALGANAMRDIAGGSQNVAVGRSGLLQTTSGNYNVALGADALYSNTTASENTAVGYQAAHSNTTGAPSVAVGFQAMRLNTTGTGVAVGSQALQNNTTGGSNTGIGQNALNANTTGGYNTAVGKHALLSNTTASNNTAVGYQASYSSTETGGNTAVGYQSLYANTGSDNSAVGIRSLTSNTTGTKNTALGYDALKSNTTAINNTAVGYQAGYSNTTGANLTAIGWQAFKNTQTALSCTGIGVNAGLNSTGNRNTFIGQGAGETITSGSENTVLGRFDGNQGGLDIRTSSNNIVLSDGDGNARMLVNGSGYMKARSVDAGFYNSAGAYHELNHNNSGSSAVIIHQQHVSYTNTSLYIQNARTNSSNYNFIITSSGNGSDNEFKLRGDGNAYADGSWNGGGADYAEYFEWDDGNTANEDRRGFSVVLVNNKLRKATADDDAGLIIGVVSGNPSVVGDTDMDAWKHKYLRDDYGTYQRDENDERILNPDYNPDQEYTSRENRPEWDTVGLMGKLRIRKGQPTGSNWIKMRDVSDTVEEWLVR
jgi:hypothetical protein